MPSYKEKKRVFLELKNEKCVEADLDLLKTRYALCPRAYIINPRRHADAILFTLLDIVPKEEIIHHRADFYRPIVAANDSDNEPKDDLNNEPKTEPENEGNAEKVETVETHKERADKAEKRAEEAEKRAQEAEERADEESERANEEEERADDAEQARDEAEERANAAEEALEQEKKKD